TGKIVRIIEKGVIVELPGGIDGFVPGSQLAFYQVKNIGDVFKIDETLNLRVIEFDAENKKIVLSATEWLKAQDKAIVDEYNSKHPVPKETLEESHKRAPRRGAKKASPAEASTETAPSIGSYELPEEMLVPEKGSEMDMTIPPTEE
ncbi:MAG: S1 RNA-binding domain-containing protein, partial [Bacteroidota bacterium]|nr:S1 RNA-binding domain-containing protein [Bacteroidota bacterium]